MHFFWKKWRKIENNWSNRRKFVNQCTVVISQLIKYIKVDWKGRYWRQCVFRVCDKSIHGDTHKYVYTITILKLNSDNSFVRQRKTKKATQAKSVYKKETKRFRTTTDVCALQADSVVLYSRLAMNVVIWKEKKKKHFTYPKESWWLSWKLLLARAIKRTDIYRALQFNKYISFFGFSFGLFLRILHEIRTGNTQFFLCFLGTKGNKWFFLTRVTV